MLSRAMKHAFCSSIEAGSGEGRAWADDTAVASKDHNVADDMRAERMRRVLSK